jgi:hypothetical protein
MLSLTRCAYWNWQEETDWLRKPKIGCQNVSSARRNGKHIRDSDLSQKEWGPRRLTLDVKLSLTASTAPVKLLDSCWISYLQL